MLGTNCNSEPENEVGRRVGIGVAEVEANQPGVVRLGFAARGSRFAIALTGASRPDSGATAGRPDRERGWRRRGWPLAHASESQVRLQVASDQAGSKHTGDFRNRGKGGQPVSPITTPDRRGYGDAYLWRIPGRGPSMVASCFREPRYRARRLSGGSPPIGCVALHCRRRRCRAVVGVGRNSIWGWVSPTQWLWFAMRGRRQSGARAWRRARRRHDGY